MEMKLFYQCGALPKEIIESNSWDFPSEMDFFIINWDI